MANPQGYYQQQPPGGYRGPQKTIEQRMHSMGTWALALGIVQLVQMGIGLLNMAVGGMNTFPSGGGPGAAEAEAMQRAVEEFQQRIVHIELLRQLPFAFMSAWSIMIGNRLRKYDREALKAAQTWVMGAFGVLVFSVLINLVFILPAAADFKDEFMKSMPNMGPGSEDMKDMMGAILTGSVIGGLLVNTILMAIWPSILKVWSGRLLKEGDTDPSNAFR